MSVRRLVLVTGASAGIGAAYARFYAREGHDLVLTARRKDRLDQLRDELVQAHGVAAHAVVADLADPAAPRAIMDAVGALDRHVDVLVNNAGYGLPGTWLHTRWEEQAAALQVMFTAPLELSHRVLPGMAERRWGRILNIASLAGFAPGARGHTTYGAIKSALIRFSQSLNVEMEGSGVHVTAVCPGFTWSEFHDANGTRARANQLPKWMWSTAEEVVETSYQACERNRAITVPGAPNKVLAALAKIMPDPLALHLVKGVRGSEYDPQAGAN